MLSNTYEIYDRLQKDKFNFTKPHVFWINERGKIRKIQAQKITERVMQRALCDNVITPIATPFSKIWHEGLYCCL